MMTYDKQRRFAWASIVMLVATLAIAGFALRGTTTVAPGLELHGPGSPVGSPGEPVGIVSTESTGISQNPSLAVDAAGNVHVAWQDATDYDGAGTDVDIFYKVRSAATGAWSTTVVVSTESDSDSQYPSLAVDAAGNVHVAWHDNTTYGGAGADFDIFYKERSAATGAWSTTAVVSTESTGNSQFPSLAVDAAGNVHVAWHDYTNYGGAGADFDIFYKARNATSGTWGTTTVVSTESTSFSIYPSLAVDAAGNVHVAWHDYTNYGGAGADFDIFYKERSAATGAWSTTAVVSTESTGGSLYPSLTVDAAGNVHVAWHDFTNYGGSGTDADIFYKVHGAATGTWSTTAVVSTESTGNSQFPSLAVDTAGNVHVAWHDITNYDGSGTDWDIFYSIRSAATGAWSTTAVVSTESTGHSQYPSLAVDAAGNVHVAWQDNTDYGGAGTDVDIFYKVRSAATGAWSTMEVVSTESSGDSYLPSLAVDAAGNVHVAWHDYTNYTGAGTDADIFYKVRGAATGAWSTTVVVSTESTGGSIRPSLAVDAAGNVHVAWHDTTSYGGAGTDVDIFYKVHGAATGTWSTTAVVSTESTGNSQFPSLAVDTAGNVHVAWHDITNYGGAGTDVDIFYKVRGGATGAWSTTAVVSTESTGTSYNPSLAVDAAGNVHVAWHDDTNYGGAGTDRDIFYKVRSAATGAWSTTAVVSTESTSNSEYPSLAVDTAGNVHVAWHDITNYGGAGTDVDIFYKVRGGATGAWSTTAVVSTESTGTSYNPSLAVDAAGNVHVAWHDITNYNGSGTDWDIFYKVLSRPAAVAFTGVQPGMLVAPGSIIPFDVALAGVQVHSAWANWDAGIATPLPGAPYHVVAPTRAGTHVLGIHYNITGGQWDAMPLAGLVSGSLVHVELYRFVVADLLPTATFTASAPIAGSWVAFSFTGSEGNGPATFQWDFGDGSANSTGRNPVHDYTTPGNYTVVLTVVDDDGDVASWSMDVIIADLLPTATFTASATIAGSWVVFSFTGSEGNGPATFQWDFGDGAANSTDRNPVHEYAAPGNHTVVLTVVDDDGDVATWSMDVVIADLLPTATFTASAPVAGSWVVFTFTGSEGNGPATFQWNFGDGSANSTDRNPVHAYTTPGTYTVVLTVTDGDGDAHAFQLAVTIPAGDLLAAIAGNPLVSLSLGAGGLLLAIGALGAVARLKKRK